MGKNTYMQSMRNLPRISSKTYENLFNFINDQKNWKLRPNKLVIFTYWFSVKCVDLEIIVYPARKSNLVFPKWCCNHSLMSQNRNHTGLPGEAPTMSITALPVLKELYSSLVFICEKSINKLHYIYHRKIEPGKWIKQSHTFHKCGRFSKESNVYFRLHMLLPYFCKV